MYFDKFLRRPRNDRPESSNKTSGQEAITSELDADFPTTVRSDRYVTTPLGWYAKTREDRDLGPFDTLAEAQQAMDQHIRDCHRINQRKFASPTRLGMHIHDPETCKKALCADCIEAKIHPAIAAHEAEKGRGE